MFSCDFTRDWLNCVAEIMFFRKLVLMLCKQDFNARMIRKILMPPAVDPEHPPMIAASAKSKAIALFLENVVMEENPAVDNVEVV